MWRAHAGRGGRGAAAGGGVPARLAGPAGGERLVPEPLAAPGLYRVLLAGQVHSTFAVNPEVRESDLGAAPEPALVGAFPSGRARIIRPGADLAGRVREARYGRELWTWFVIAALVLLAAETLIARWGMAGRVAEPAPAGGA